ncbi:RNA polymerase sigma factor [Actinomadura rubrisoli]|uniref:RNA polymerase sigma factor n=1 Tax=Actinomadura rubrisoli TaxID=2530368 RepID=A0A4R5CAT0_9ACTN|nr:RNA polymerase sigma factor [Actinomadura rubrisoli]TDD95826.1 RNA polymerase sigma factor [Actinomadura rubrisoli]
MTAPPDTPAVLDDAGLLRESLHDPERFAVLYDRHLPAVHRYLAGRLGREGSEDLAAETFLIAFRRRRDFDPGRGAVRPWLFGIATHLVAQHRRTEARRLKLLGRIATEDSVAGHEERVTAQVTAWAARPDLVRAMSALSRGDRDVVFLAALGGLGYEEIGQALGIPSGTVGSRLTRARRKLRQALGGIDPLEEN